MLNLAIPIPTISGRQEIEIDMKIGEDRHKIHYRVELYRWEDNNPKSKDRVACVKDLLNEYSKDWEIYDIGIPSDDCVPLTFIKRDDWEKQRQLVRKALTSEHHTSRV